MNHKKNDIFAGHTILLPLKDNAPTETYRARTADGRLCALKISPTVGELQVARLSPLFIASGDDYVAYRYISGELLSQRIARLHSLPKAEVMHLMEMVSVQLQALHSAGYAHNGLTADNILIDIAPMPPDAWLSGLSNVTAVDEPEGGWASGVDWEGGASSPRKSAVQQPSGFTDDIKAMGRLMYLMLFGKEPDSPPRLPNRPDLDERTINILYKALMGDFADAGDMLAAVTGKTQVKRAHRPMGEGFAAVAGMDEIKKRLQEDVIDILADLEGAAEYGITIPNGMLLYGPPGCGKTFIAERFAEQAGYNYRYVKSSDLASIYIHGSQEKIGDLFDDARHNAPMILCFDEFDALVPVRDHTLNASHSGEVNEFLSQLNNCGRDGVFVIATTNRPDRIDPAVLRTGRIDYMAYVPLPDAKAREQMFRLALGRRPVQDGMPYASLAKDTEGYLMSDIKAIVEEAARKAFRSKTPISAAMIREALSRRSPSLSKADINQYEQLRQRYQSQRQGTGLPRVGFLK